MLLLLADGRFPGGGHAHSGGLEAAVADGSVFDEATLGSFLRGRVTTAGPTDAWFAAEAARRMARVAADARVAASVSARPSPLVDLAAWYEARCASSAQRSAARVLGRGLRRVAVGVWPEAGRIDVEPYPVVLGAVSHLGGLSDVDAARLVVHSLLMGTAAAAPKLFSIDMVDAMRAAASVAAMADAAVATAADPNPPSPRSAPLTELRAEAHAAWDVRLFAS